VLAYENLPVFPCGFPDAWRQGFGINPFRHSRTVRDVRF
jgi:hypothetical protein